MKKTKIYIAVEHVIHFDWERKRVIGASFDEGVCQKIIEKAESEFKSFDGEYAEYWTEHIPITENAEAVTYDAW